MRTAWVNRGGETRRPARSAPITEWDDLWPLANLG